jgi:conjugative transposon TraM protein
MQTNPYSARFLRQRKFFMVLPLLVSPFLIILFIALGGGRGGGAKGQKPKASQGLSLVLPDAHFKIGKEPGKFELYETAARDSIRIREAIRKDAYYKPEKLVESVEALPEPEKLFEKNSSKYSRSSLSNLRMPSTESLEEPTTESKIMEKLTQLKAVMNDKTVSGNGAPSHSNYSVQPVELTERNPDIDKMEKMEKMMAAIKNEPGEDPELKDLNTMLDKIEAIQHPENKPDSLRGKPLQNREEVFAVRNENPVPDNFSNDSSQQSGFYGLGEEGVPDEENSKQNAIEAIIPETETLVAGSTVKLQLMNDVNINGNPISKAQWVYGTASINNERLKISIHSIRSGNSILPVALEAYDMDGMEGIYIPGSISRESAKQSSDQAIGSIGLAGLDPSIGAQAANAGIQAAKTLLSKKIKLIQVSVAAGYRVLLKDNSRR